MAEFRLKMYKTEKIKQSLLKKGFILEERDRSYFGFYHSGKATGIFTKVSHGSAPPGKDTLSKIKRLLHFNSKISVTGCNGLQSGLERFFTAKSTNRKRSDDNISHNAIKDR
ncbi:MAG: hypothetical protein ACYDAP_13630 [Thermoplasmataceae archaeon]